MCAFLGGPKSGPHFLETSVSTSIPSNTHPLAAPKKIEPPQTLHGLFEWPSDLFLEIVSHSMRSTSTDKYFIACLPSVMTYLEGQGYLVSGLIMGVIGVTIWVIEVIKPLTDPPSKQSRSTVSLHLSKLGDGWPHWVGPCSG